MKNQERLIAIIDKGFHAVYCANMHMHGKFKLFKVCLTNTNYQYATTYFPKIHEIRAIKSFATRLLRESGDKVTIYVVDHIYHDEALKDDKAYCIPLLSREASLSPRGDIINGKWREEF